MITRAVVVSGGLALRNLLLVRRMPSVFLPALIMPIFILVATAGAFRGVGVVPQLEGVSYLAFTIPFATVMGGGFAGINAGMTLARDIQGGFVDRLVASPAPRVVLILGPLTAACVRSLVSTTAVLLVASLGGVFPPGVGGTLVIYLMAAMFAAATACWSMGVALQTRSVQSIPLMQVVIFLSVFLSVAYVPRELQTGWLRTASDLNPVTRLLEASRAPEVASVSWDTLGPGLAAGLLLIGVLGAFALLGLRTLGRR
jgi:ABC-2 type transport system permease protein